MKLRTSAHRCGGVGLGALHDGFEGWRPLPPTPRNGSPPAPLVSRLSPLRMPGDELGHRRRPCRSSPPCPWYNRRPSRCRRRSPKIRGDYFSSVPSLAGYRGGYHHPPTKRKRASIPYRRSCSPGPPPWEWSTMPTVPTRVRGQPRSHPPPAPRPAYRPNTRPAHGEYLGHRTPRYPMASTMWTPRRAPRPSAGSCSGCWRHSGTLGLKATGTEMWVSMYWRSPRSHCEPTRPASGWPSGDACCAPPGGHASRLGGGGARTRLGAGQGQRLLHEYMLPRRGRRLHDLEPYLVRRRHHHTVDLGVRPDLLEIGWPPGIRASRRTGHGSPDRGHNRRPRRPTSTPPRPGHRPTTPSRSHPPHFFIRHHPPSLKKTPRSCPIHEPN